MPLFSFGAVTSNMRYAFSFLSLLLLTSIYYQPSMTNRESLNLYFTS
jgi:hypothetical protein